MDIPYFRADFYQLFRCVVSRLRFPWRHLLLYPTLQMNFVPSTSGQNGQTTNPQCPSPSSPAREAADGSNCDESRSPTLRWNRYFLEDKRYGPAQQNKGMGDLTDTLQKKKTCFSIFYLTLSKVRKRQTGRITDPGKKKCFLVSVFYFF